MRRIAKGTPFVAEELWERLGNAYSVHHQPWPAFEEALTVVDSVEIPVQINGKVRDKIVVPRAADELETLAMARESAKVQEHLAGKSVVREIVVPGRMVNLVVK